MVALSEGFGLEDLGYVLFELLMKRELAFFYTFVFFLFLVPLSFLFYQFDKLHFIDCFHRITLADDVEVFVFELNTELMCVEVLVFAKVPLS